jgi:hypothetical protein
MAPVWRVRASQFLFGGLGDTSDKSEASSHSTNPGELEAVSRQVV